MKCEYCFTRAGRAGPEDIAARIPELTPLRNAKVALFGLGCLGAPAAIELAKAGVAELGILDHDTVDPGTIVRWPRGLTISGRFKTKVIKEWIIHEFPYCKIKDWPSKLGGIRNPDDRNKLPDEQIVEEMTQDANLIFDATAEPGVHNYLAYHARKLGIPYVGMSATPGGWGGRVFRIKNDDSRSGCYWCYLKWSKEDKIIEPPFDPNGSLQTAGCGDTTFTGTGFDMLDIAMMGVRVVVSTLCENHEVGYPRMNWDVTHISFRNEQGELLPPVYMPHSLPVHPECPICNLK